MMLDTAVQHTLNKQTVMKILQFGTKNLFDRSSEDELEDGKWSIDQLQLESILDRENQFAEVDGEQGEGQDYLGNFKVADYDRKRANLSEV